MQVLRQQACFLFKGKRSALTKVRAWVAESVSELITNVLERVVLPADQDV
jgi:hypothetical protein